MCDRKPMRRLQLNEEVGGGGLEEEELELYVRLETRKRVQTNEAKSKRCRASGGGGERLIKDLKGQANSLENSNF